MAIAYRQSASKDGTGSLAYGSDVLVNSLLVLILRTGTTGVTPTASDTLTNTWVAALQVDATDGGGDHYTFFYVKNTTAGANTVTIANLGAGTARWAIGEYTGLDTTAPLDQTANTGTNSASPNSGSTGTTAVADELLVGGLTFQGIGSGDTFTPGAGWTTRQRQTAVGGQIKVLLMDQIVSSTGTYAASGTLDQSQNWYAGIFTFKIAAGGGGFVAREPQQVGQAVKRAAYW